MVGQQHVWCARLSDNLVIRTRKKKHGDGEKGKGDGDSEF